MDDIDWHKKWGSSLPHNASIHTRFYGAGTLGFNTKTDHAITIFLHAITCVLIANVLNPTTAILWGIHPANHQISIWVNGRRYQIVIILVLIMLIVPKQFIFIPFILTGVFQFTALFSPILVGNVFFVMIPVILIMFHKNIFDAIRIRKKLLKDFLPKNILLHLVIILKCFGFCVIKFFGFINPYMALYPFLEGWRRTDAGDRDAYSINLDLLIGIIAFCIFALLFIVLPEKQIILFIFLSTLQYSCIIPVTQIGADRYISLPLIFVLYLLVKYLPIIAIFIAPILLLKTLYTMTMYKNIQSFYAFHVKHCPGLLKLSLLKKLYPQINTNLY